MPAPPSGKSLATVSRGCELHSNKSRTLHVIAGTLGMFYLALVATTATAQTPPSASEIAAYQGLHSAAHEGDVAAIRRLAAEGADLEARDDAGRTPLHAAHA